jgi:hypothetical protein
MTFPPRQHVPGERNEKPAIAVFAFRRPDLLRLTLQSLERADGFGTLPVYLFSDAPRSTHASDIGLVGEVRALLSAWSAQHDATLYESSRNLGLRKSIVEGVTRILGNHDSVIVIEDDIVVSRCFLAFMAQALEGCRNRDDIMQVSGYFVPHDEHLPPVGLVRSPGSWGWATWRRAWNYYVDDAELLLEQVRHTDTAAFDFGGSYAFLEALEKNSDGRLDTWAVRWYASMWLRGGYAVYPALSMTRNIGFRKDATNTTPSRTAATFTNQPVAQSLPRIDWTRLGRNETIEYVNELERFYRWQHAEWTRPSWRARVAARWQRLARGHTPD